MIDYQDNNYKKNIMKTKNLIFLLIVFSFFTNSFAQKEITTGKKTIKMNTAPKLVIKNIVLNDADNNSIIDAEEEAFIKLLVRNTGSGHANSINIETIISSGDSIGVSFKKSTHVGNLKIGEEKEIKIPINTVINLKDGSATLKLIALEANNFNSEALYFDLAFKAKDIPLGISWYYPSMTNTSVDKNEYIIKACIMSSSKVKNVLLYLNGELYSENRGLKLIKTSTCDYNIEETIKLKNGLNELKIVATNEKTTVNSEIRKINVIETAFEHRLALIIGNSNYNFAPLRNPANDAASMAQALRDLKFEVIEIIDGNKDTMKAAVRAFHNKLNEYGGVGFFYYAGHGIQVKGENYIVPVNHEIQEEYDVPDEAIRVNTVLAYMENSKTRMNIVVLDACRDNPYARSMRSGSRGLAQIYAEGSGSLIAYATAPGSVASDGAGENGLYTQELLKAIKTPGLEIGMVFRKVLTNVKKISKGKQIPWTNASIEGEFYFIK